MTRPNVETLTAIGAMAVPALAWGGQQDTVGRIALCAVFFGGIWLAVYIGRTPYREMLDGEAFDQWRRHRHEFEQWKYAKDRKEHQ